MGNIVYIAFESDDISAIITNIIMGDFGSQNISYPAGKAFYARVGEISGIISEVTSQKLLKGPKEKNKDV